MKSLQRHQTAWLFWAVGTALIVLSWVNIVSPQVGWYGFGISLVGSILNWGLRLPRALPPRTDDDPRG